MAGHRHVRDRAPAALVAARARADGLSLHNVSFRQGDPAEMAIEQPFDAVVGRYDAALHEYAAAEQVYERSGLKRSRLVRIAARTGQ
jgi:hypothetical protein